MNEVAPPRISRARAAVMVVVGLALAGAALGALWAWIAPPIHGVIALTKSGNRVHAALGAESDNFFIAAFLLVGLVVALAVVSAVLVWQWRPHRGPVLCTALAIGSAAAAGAAAGVGALIVRSRYDIIDIAGAPISPEHRVHLRDRSPAGVLRALRLADRGDRSCSPRRWPRWSTALIAVSTSRDDLGGWPPVEPVLPPPVTVDGVLPSAP